METGSGVYHEKSSPTYAPLAEFYLRTNLKYDRDEMVLEGFYAFRKLTYPVENSLQLSML